MQSPNQKKFRGISGVVIAVLLAVIGIAAVLMFWGMMSGFFTPQPKVIIEKATITKIGNKYDISITVRETGGASTKIERAIITGGDLTTEQDLSTAQQQDTTLSPGQSKTLVYETTQSLKPGVTYYVAVYYTKGDGTERSDLYPVTVR
ncbi:MAG: hypothetical protein ACO2PN_12425 [Pyrobaculum sp.]|jgi:ATP-dependent protease ClpP protease subunit